MSHAAGDNLFDIPDRRNRSSAAGVGLLLTPILVGGALALVALAGKSRIGLWLRGFLSAGDAAARDELRRRINDGTMTRLMLRDWLVGRTKAQIAARFGPPRTAALRTGGSEPTGQAAFWRADTWYYALQDDTRAALAVKFGGNVAWEVDFVDTPALESAAEW